MESVFLCKSWQSDWRIRWHRPGSQIHHSAHPNTEAGKKTRGPRGSFQPNWQSSDFIAPDLAESGNAALCFFDATLRRRRCASFFTIFFVLFFFSLPINWLFTHIALLVLSYPGPRFHRLQSSVQLPGAFAHLVRTCPSVIAQPPQTLKLLISDEICPPAGYL